MAAKDLSPEQRTEAVKLKAAFKEWQARRRERGEEWQQDAAAHELGFGQSALSQYLGGLIPLNQSGICAALDDELMAMVQGRADADTTI